MTTDFKASQLQTNKIIVTGSFAGDGSNQLLIYNHDADDSVTPNQGVIDPAKFDTSSGIGSDVFLFVSGGISTKDTAGSYGVSVIGGDLHISGNLSIDGTGGGGGGGIANLQEAYDASEIVDISSTNGALTLRNTGSLPDTTACLSVSQSPTGLARPGDAIYIGMSALSQGDGISANMLGGSSGRGLYVSSKGTGNCIDVSSTSGGATGLSISSTAGRAAVLEGTTANPAVTVENTGTGLGLLVTGSSTSAGAKILNKNIGPALVVENSSTGVGVAVTGSVEATLGLSGSLTKLADGSSYLIAGDGISITSASNGSVTISQNVWMNVTLGHATTNLSTNPLYFGQIYGLTATTVSPVSTANQYTFVSPVTGSIRKVSITTSADNTKAASLALINGTTAVEKTVRANFSQSGASPYYNELCSLTSSLDISPGDVIYFRLNYGGSAFNIQGVYNLLIQVTGTVWP
jgi:hypothetical protein